MTLAVTEMTNWAVDLIGVRKTYGRGPNRVEALRGVNIQVGRGEIFGLLGPNGAGKSTLVKIMMTVVRADEAMGTMLGRPLGNRKKLAVTGYLPENHRFPPYLTAVQLLDYYAALAKVERKRRRENAARLLTRVGMGEWADMRIGKYSKGMMQRLGLAQALMNDPELVVLDEPTDGVDPVGRRDIRALLIELKREGKTIFLNSHLLSELEMVCDRVAILVDGMVARQGTLSELTEHTVEYRIATAASLDPLRAELEARGAVVSNGAVVVKGHETQRVNELIDFLRGRGMLIESVGPHRFSLEDILVETMGAQTTPPVGAPPVARPIGRR